MADDQEREGSLIDTRELQTLSNDTVVVPDSDIQTTDSQTVCDGLLEEAFHESENFDGNPASYPGSEAASEAQVIVHTVVSDGSLNGEIMQSATDGTLYENSYTDVGGHAHDHVGSLTSDDLCEVASTHDMESTQHHLEDSSQPTPEVSGEGTALSVTLMPSSQLSDAPLGSSQNPIRIIQQGNQYTPVQQLTAEQLQQIMQVVQQQQLTRSAEEGGGHSILFNPQTNTRIVYRVIYPSELHKNTSTEQPTRVTFTQGQQTGMNLPKRTYKKRPRGEDEDENKLDGPELSKEEKEARKKHRPRTRSGRVSKPPKHMVQDYKHIHVLDWDEDYDDSDGGYSDFKCSDEEKGEGRSKKEGSDSAEIFQGLGSTRPKNFKCETCDKAYIGRAGLGRHYRLHPDHGSLPPETETEKAERTNGVGSTGSMSEDSNTQDSLPSIGTPSTTHVRIPSYPRRGRRPHRGRYAHLQDAPLRKKAKLREFIRDYEDEELMEVVLPRLANVITLWEFLLMKVERGGPAKPRADNIYREFEELYKQVHKVCQEYLRPLSADDSEASAPMNKMQVQSNPLAQALGLEAGAYEVKDMPCSEESPFHYKYLTVEPMGLQGKRVHERRTVEIVTPDQLVSEPSAKKPRMLSLLTNTTVTVPDLSARSKSRASNQPSFVISAKPSAGLTGHSRAAIVAVPHSQQSVHHSRDEIQDVLASSSDTSQSDLPAGLSSICCDTTSASPSSMVGVQVILRDALAPGESNSTIASIMSTSDSHGLETPDAETAAGGSFLSQDPVVTESSSSLEYTFAQSDKCVESKDVTLNVISKPSMEHVAMNGQSNGIVIDQNGLSDSSTISNSMELITESQVIDAGQLEGQVLTHSTFFQTEDGFFIIQNPDGTAYQIQSNDGNMPFEAVQAVMAMQGESQLEANSQVHNAT